MKWHIIPNEVFLSDCWSKFDPVSPGASFYSLIIFIREISLSIKEFSCQKEKNTYKSSLN